MSEKFKVDKELNFAGSLILASVLLSKYNVELANISINENGCFVEFSTKQIISSNDLQNIEISCYDLIDLAGRITLGSKDHLNKYEQYFSEHNTQPSNFYNVNGQNVYSFGYELKVPFDIKTIKVFKLLSIGGTK
jgi:threonyl-tRNA synthetase